ncbi:MAG: hypothetical protein JXB00_10555 [Bacteroidales bacterium]|nr:hypothetical protein [Bacteroidales bacterium]
MVISKNPEPRKEVFQSLLDNTIAFLKSDSNKNQKTYETLLGNKLEGVVADIMSERAKGSPFENSIELISGQKFPDIIAKKYYGVEVKTSKQDHWTTTGNSVLESTRVEGVERIYMLFGKMVSPFDFKCRPYEECLSEVVVTHSPRYLIDMNLSAGQTIFDKLAIPYDTLRTSTNPIKPILDYYRQFLKAGDEVWWLDQDEPKSTGLIIKSWNNLLSGERNRLIASAMVYFPEVFSNSPDKFNRVATWLINHHGVVCPNMRDPFTAGGKGTLLWKGKLYKDVQRVIINMAELLESIKASLTDTDKMTLNQYWGIKVDDKFNTWIELVASNCDYMGLPINLRKYLKEKLLP